MQKYYILFVLLHLSILSFAQKEADIIGKWQSTTDKSRIIEIYKAKDGHYYGKTIEDKLILKDLKYDVSKNSFIGKMNPPEASITLSATISFENTRKIKMVATKLFISKTAYFNKIN